MADLWNGGPRNGGPLPPYILYSMLKSSLSLFGKCLLTIRNTERALFAAFIMHGYLVSNLVLHYIFSQVILFNDLFQLLDIRGGFVYTLNCDGQNCTRWVIFGLELI